MSEMTKLITMILGESVIEEDTMFDEEIPQKEILDFIMNNPTPSDDDFHSLADDLGIDPKRLEEMVYNMFHIFLTSFKHMNDPDEDFDPDELEMGIQVEYEHTNIRWLAKIIAKAHLSEFPDYYSRLKDMEEQAKRDWAEYQDEENVGEDEFNDEGDNEPE